MLFFEINLLLDFVCLAKIFFEEILKSYNIEMHHLTPNGIAKIVLFIWAVKAQGVNPNIKAFCVLNEMHAQFRNKMVEGKKVIKYFGCCSFKPARAAKQISPASKNKSNEDWYKFWFYHKVPFVEERNGSRKLVESYLLAAKMGKNAFECKPTLGSAKNSKICEKAYKLIVNMQGARDLYEEYLAARV